MHSDESLILIFSALVMYESWVAYQISEIVSCLIVLWGEIFLERQPGLNATHIKGY